MGGWKELLTCWSLRNRVPQAGVAHYGKFPISRLLRDREFGNWGRRIACCGEGYSPWGRQAYRQGRVL